VALLNCSHFHTALLMQRPYLCVLSAQAQQAFASSSLQHGSNSTAFIDLPTLPP
jgi:hypothetical protein